MITVERNIHHSQNFLHDIDLVRSLVNTSGISSSDTVIEIGPGKGIITSALAKKECNVIAVELDKHLADELSKLFINKKNVVICNMDFLQYKLPSERYKVFANIPFNMTAEILQKLLEASILAEDIFLIMQLEAIQKYAGQPYGSETLRSLMYKPLYSVMIEHEFQPTDFIPTPKADIGLAHFKKKDNPDVQTEDLGLYYDFLNYVFSAPGTTIKEKTKKIFSYEQQKRIGKLYGVKTDSLLSNITYEQWLEMFKTFVNYVSPEKKKIVVGETDRRDAERNNLKKIHRHRRTRESKNSMQ